MQYRLIYISFILSSLPCVFAYSQSKDTQTENSISSTWMMDSVRTKPSNPQWEVDSIKIRENIIVPFYNYQDNLDLTIESMGAFAKGDNAPFWITNNRHGIGSVDRNKGYLRLKSQLKHYIDPSSGFNVSGGIDLLVSNNLNSDFYLQQLYADLNYKNIRLSVGSKERKSLFKNTELSSGGLTLSNNARPIPQVEFSIPEFVNIPHTHNKLQVMGGVSYGWYMDNKFKENNSSDGNYAKNILYHRKYGFLKYKPNTAWNFIAGLEMDTQWGGRFYKKGEYWDKSSAGIKDFFKVLLPMSGGSNSNITDKVNIVGNVYGSSHFIVEYKKNEYEIKVYHEHFFEDHSGLFFKNIPDGLYGIEIKLNNQSWLSGILFEYLHSKDQSGPFLWDKNETIPVQVSGGDNYYNQVDYISLTNYGYVIGNPFFTSPIYNKGESLTVYNTRLSAFHGGISGHISKRLQYRALVSYSRSWGTPLIPSTYIRDQFSSMLEATYTHPKLDGWLFTGAFAYDKSQMIGDNTGVQIKVVKTFDIR